MKIVNIVDEFYPTAGYENNVLSKYFVQDGYEYIILTTDLEDNPFFKCDNLAKMDREFEEKTGVTVIRLHAYKKISGRAIWNFPQFCKKIEEIRADVLFFCGNDTLIAIQYILSKASRNKTIVMDSHMLEMASENKFRKYFRKFYKRIVAPILIKRKIPVIRLQNDDYVERCLGIPLSQSPWISFGSDTLLFHPDTYAREMFRKENHIPEESFLVVYAGKLDDAKGGKFLAEAISSKFVTKREIVFLIVGSTCGDYGEAVDKILNASENRIVRFPTQPYSNLAKFFQAADLVIFPKQCSLSFYDAEACGTPVLSEDNNINVDRCSHNNGWNFRSGDSDSLRNSIIELSEIPLDEYQTYRDNALKYILKSYDYRDKAKEYEMIIEEYLRTLS